MKQLALLCTLPLLMLMAKAGAAEASCPIVPTPKVYRAAGRTAQMHTGAAIVLGAKATEPERYAAERLQTLIERRFRRRLPIRAEDKVGESARQVFLLGQRTTRPQETAWCHASAIAS